MEWLAENWLVVVTSVVTIASVIVKITPNETDNKILEIIIKIFEKLGLNTPPVKPKND
tara:strand:- start:1188 stop:1361 length:174 start_codon:yes stop_codon:yes gene_type:complete